MIDEGIMFMLNEDGVADVYDDTYDVTIHCASEEEQKKTIEALNRGMKCKWIPCSGCSDCKHKECEHHGKI